MLFIFLTQTVVTTKGREEHIEKECRCSTVACQGSHLSLWQQKEQGNSDTGRAICINRETEACSLVCQEIPLGKPLASVNYIQALSMRFTVPCCFTLNPLVSHSLYPFLLCFHLVSLFFIIPFSSVSFCHMKYCSTFPSFMRQYNSKMLLLRCRVISLYWKAPQAVPFFRLCQNHFVRDDINYRDKCCLTSFTPPAPQVPVSRRI